LPNVLQRARAEQFCAEHRRIGFGHAADGAELPRDRRHPIGARLDLRVAGRRERRQPGVNGLQVCPLALEPKSQSRRQRPAVAGLRRRQVRYTLPNGSSRSSELPPCCAQRAHGGKLGVLLALSFVNCLLRNNLSEHWSFACGHSPSPSP